MSVGDLVRRKTNPTVGRVTRVYDNGFVQVYWDQGVPWNYSRLKADNVTHANRGPWSTKL